MSKQRTAVKRRTIIPKQLAVRIVRKLFANYRGELVQRLVLTDDTPRKVDWGGWSQVAAMKLVEDELRSALNPTPPRSRT